MGKITIIAMLILSFSCQNKTEKKAVDHHWDIFRIELDSKSFWVVSDSDTCYYSAPRVNVFNQKDFEEKRELTKVVIPKAERDTIFKLAIQAITKPVHTDDEVSCYAGEYVKLSLEENITTISCTYSSVQDWTLISPTLARIHKLTFGR